MDEERSVVLAVHGVPVRAGYHGRSHSGARLNGVRFIPLKLNLHPYVNKYQHGVFFSVATPFL
jgi:hypothetical protein